VTQATFANNSADFGGAIFNDLGATLTVNPGTSFTGNSATFEGGAICNDGPLAVSGTSFTNNTAQYGGGILGDGAGSVTGCSFTGNSATSYGGAFFSVGALTVSGCTIQQNTAQLGGGIANFGGAVTVSGCAIEFNSASISGGGIYTTNSGTTDVTGSQVIFNSPDDTHTDPASTLIVFNSIIGVET
jgi:predicted outer membrane repeat protein